MSFKIALVATLAFALGGCPGKSIGTRPASVEGLEKVTVLSYMTAPTEFCADGLRSLRLDFEQNLKTVRVCNESTGETLDETAALSVEKKGDLLKLFQETFVHRIRHDASTCGASLQRLNLERWEFQLLSGKEIVFHNSQAECITPETDLSFGGLFDNDLENWRNIFSTIE